MSSQRRCVLPRPLCATPPRICLDHFRGLHMARHLTTSDFLALLAMLLFCGCDTTVRYAAGPNDLADISLILKSDRSFEFNWRFLEDNEAQSDSVGQASHQISLLAPGNRQLIRSRLHFLQILRATILRFSILQHLRNLLSPSVPIASGSERAKNHSLYGVSCAHGTKC